MTGDKHLMEQALRVKPEVPSLEFIVCMSPLEDLYVVLSGWEGDGEAPFRMPACGGAEGSEGAGAKAPGDFRPWEMCPCRNFCEHGKKTVGAAPQGSPPDR